MKPSFDDAVGALTDYWLRQKLL